MKKTLAMIVVALFAASAFAAEGNMNTSTDASAAPQHSMVKKHKKGKKKAKKSKKHEEKTEGAAAAPAAAPADQGAAAPAAGK